MKRALRKIAVALGAITALTFVTAAGIVIWACLSPSGLRFLAARVLPRLPAGVSIDTVSGRLAGPLELAGIAVRTDTMELRVARAELRWNPRALLDRTFDVEGLDVSGVDVVALAGIEPREPAEPLRLPERIELPVDVRVAAASIDAIRYFASPGTEPLAIEHVSAAGRLDGDALEVGELSVHAPLFDVSAAVSVVPRVPYVISGRLEWVVRPAGYPEVRGSAQLSGDSGLVTIEPRAAEPYEARATVRVAEPLTAPRIDGDAELTIEPAALGVTQLPVDAVHSRLSVRGPLDALEVTAHLDLAGGEIDGVTADLAARYAGDGVEVRALDLAEPVSGAALHASGRVTMDGEQPALDLTARWSNFGWPLRGDRQVRTDGGTLTLRGTLDDYTLALDGGLALADEVDGKVSASGTGGSDALRLERVEIEALRGRIAGQANVRWTPKLAGAAEVTATGIDPGVLLPGWPGQLGAHVRADAALDGDALSVALHELAVKGRLRDRPVDLDARGGYAGDTLRLDSLALRSGASSASTHGTAGSSLALEWRVESPDLADLWPGLAGRLSAHGGLSGPRARPRIGVEAHGSGLAFETSAVKDFDLAADVDVAGKAPSSLALAVAGARLPGVAAERLRLDGKGNAAHHELSLSAATSAGDAELALTGSLADPWTRAFAWTFDVGTATFGYAQLAPWTLREPASGRLTRTEAELERSCWQSSGAELCVEGTRVPGRLESRFALSQLPFDYFAALLAMPVSIDGGLSVEGTFEQLAKATPRFDARLFTSPGRIASGGGAAGDGRTVVAGGPPVTLAFGPAEGRVAMSDDRLEASLRVPFEDDGSVEASARIGTGDGAPFEKRSLDGRLSIAAASLGFVGNLVAELQNTQGSVNGDLRASGTVGSPRLAGTLALADGKATLPDANVQLEDVSVELTGDGANGLTVDARARSGGGNVNAAGRLSLSGGDSEGRITVDGDAFEVFDTPDAQIAVSPDLALTLTPGGLALTGTVTVPHARLTPRDTGTDAVAPSRDQRIVSSGDGADRADARPFSANVQLALGDDVSVQGYGLTGRLAGAVQIGQKPGEPATGTGTLRVENGVYEAYGQKLEIESGRVVFAGGPIDEPGVDIQAVRHPAEDVTVGARVRGLLTAPELSLYSEPSLPQQEQLSYLVLGRPLENASASESSAMSRAALALALKGGNFVSKRINQNLGLDTFGIEADTGQPAEKSEFVIGKYLTPSLYVSYGIGLFEPVNTVRLRYALARRWRLVTESSSEASGGDVIYNVERR